MPYKNPEDRKTQWRRWRENNRDRSREIQANYRKRNADKVAATNAAGKAANPERERANEKFRFAIKRGWIKRQGEQFHHPDYSRPYYGCWVTAEQHRQIHAGMIKCLPCHDYQEQVDVLRMQATADRNRRGGEASWNQRSRREVCRD